ncbi:MAG TPA: FdhF/YdeP family oxidoreductase [Mycobacteriales bacterium]|nr:FdhF/YdeP family oxidoreductase [Mycobacteriales bacterium]
MVDGPDEQLKIGKPKAWAAGLPGVLHSLQHVLREGGVINSAKALKALNQKDGFDCMSCAWPDPPDRKLAEFCENGAKAVGFEIDRKTVQRDFWAEHSVDDLAGRDEYWLGQQGRLVEPVFKPEGEDHYRPVGWDEALQLIADELRALSTPDEAIFYTSGRTSNEAAYVYQLFIRAFGTNNLPDCSNMCHESTSVALAETIGIGKASVRYTDFAQADLIVIMGQNPGTNHPRMLTALEEAKRAGASIIAVNPLPEAGLQRFKNPQRPGGIVGKGTRLADVFLPVRLGGDLALLQAVSKRVLESGALDQEFLDEKCAGFGEFAAHVAGVPAADVREATGLTEAQIDDFARRYIAADRVIICWAMGLTQHKAAVATIREIVNLQALRGNIGKPGAGLAPIRGHSNVQGDRTMGIWERPRPAFLDGLEREFGIPMPRHNGFDVVDSIRAMRDGRASVFVAMGGNFVSAVSDTAVAEAALRSTALTVQVSTKLNRSHGVTGRKALILPTLGRTEIDEQRSGPQFVSVEDTVCAVHPSHGRKKPASDDLRSEVAIVCDLAERTVGSEAIDWRAFRDDYDRIRDRIARTVPGCEDYNAKIRADGGFVLPHGPRDSRTFPTASGKLELTVNELEWPHCPPGRLLLQTVRSHDQYNTTIYGLDDRYRGVRRGRRVVFVNPEDLTASGFADGDIVDLHSEFTDGVDRCVSGFRIVSFPTARGCAAAYFPETNPLVPLDSQADRSGTPTSKAIVIRFERTPA